MPFVITLCYKIKYKIICVHKQSIHLLLTCQF